MNITYTLSNHGFEIRRGFTPDPAWTVLSRQETAPAEDWRQDLDNAEAGNLVVWVARTAANFSNGGIKLCPSSHKHGKLTPAEARAHAARPFAAPELEAGDAIVMDPLTIHAKAQGDGARFERIVCAIR
jgi:ectoine hydroxylase-related dioxygenase (phytanoyl-CoA dioxygenase family)